MTWHFLTQIEFSILTFLWAPTRLSAYTCHFRLSHCCPVLLRNKRSSRELASLGPPMSLLCIRRWSTGIVDRVNSFHVPDNVCERLSCTYFWIGWELLNFLYFSGTWMWCQSFPTTFRFNGYRNSVLRLCALSNRTGGGEEGYLCAEKQPVLLLLVDGTFGLLLRKSSLRSILGCFIF